MAEAGSGATRPIEWVMAIGGGLALAAVLVWVLRGPAVFGTGETVVAAPEVVSVPVAVPLAAPVAVPVVETVSLAGLMLRGIVQRADGAAAIIESGDGRQRLVRVGGEVRPGVRLERVEGHSVVLAAGSARQSLGFGDAVAGTPAADSAEAPQGVAVSAGLRELAATSTDYRLGLKARRQGGGIAGFTIVDTARLPLLRKAGLRPGDVVLAINGSALQSEEKIIELPNEVSGAYAVDIAFERDGKQQSASVAIDKNR